MKKNKLTTTTEEPFDVDAFLVRMEDWQAQEDAYKAREDSLLKSYQTANTIGSVIALLLLLIHFLKLMGGRKKPISSLIVLLVAISISDFLLLLSNVANYLFLEPGLLSKTDPNLPLARQFMVKSLLGFVRQFVWYTCKHCSTWFAVFLAAFQVVSTVFPFSPSVQTIQKTGSAVRVILGVTLLCGMWNALYFVLQVMILDNSKFTTKGLNLMNVEMVLMQLYRNEANGYMDINLTAMLMFLAVVTVIRFKYWQLPSSLRFAKPVLLVSITFLVSEWAFSSFFFSARQTSYMYPASLSFLPQLFLTFGTLLRAIVFLAIWPKRSEDGKIEDQSNAAKKPSVPVALY